MESSFWWICALFILASPTFLCGTAGDSVRRGGAERQEDGGDLEQYTINITMDGVLPEEDDEYLCYASTDISGLDKYIVSMEALAHGERAHHILLYGCEFPYKDRVNRSWQCTSICRHGAPKIIWAWAKNAQPTQLPKEVGVMVGGDSGINQLVLQIHYKDKMAASDEPDRSGIRLTMTKQRKNYLAGIMIFLTGELLVKPGQPNVHAEVSCMYRGKQVMHPFAYRVHTHTLGSVVSAFHNNGSWSMIGKGNPQWPQAFYPINDTTMKIMPNEKLAARCTYDGARTQVPVRIGSTHKDEMCNFYLMYYTEATSNPELSFDCDGNQFPKFIGELPAGNDVPLPPNPALEEKAAHSHPSPRIDKPSSAHIITKDIKEDVNWLKLLPKDNINLGQVTGVAVDTSNRLHFFHRGGREWGPRSFDWSDVFTGTEPIKVNTLVKLNEAGGVVDQWGADMFYMPHALHIDQSDNIWITDVALHQVMKFPAGKRQPSLVLGQKLRPGSDTGSFCKPTDVATLPSGEFFVADGYCNNRIMKFTADGKFLKQWGVAPTQRKIGNTFPPPEVLFVPHSLAIVEKKQWVCVADRENGRITCFDYDGNFQKQFHPKEFDGNVFAIAYDNNTDILYAINERRTKNKPRGFMIRSDTGNLISMFQPTTAAFGRPHDITVDETGRHLYVADIGPNKVWKFNVDLEKTQVSVEQSSVDNSGVKVKIDKRPGSSTSSELDLGAEQAIEDAAGDVQDMGASLVIGCLLIVPVIIIVGVSVFMRLRKTGKFSLFTVYRNNKNRRFNLGNFFGNHKGFDPLNTEEHEELDHLNSDSDVEEYSATTHKA